MEQEDVVVFFIYVLSDLLIYIHPDDTNAIKCRIGSNIVMCTSTLAEHLQQATNQLQVSWYHLSRNFTKQINPTTSKAQIPPSKVRGVYLQTRLRIQPCSTLSYKIDNYIISHCHNETYQVVAKKRDRVKPPIEKDMEGLYL